MNDAPCDACTRRTVLLAELSAVLDRTVPDRERLGAALELDAERLLAALGGRRREELRAKLASLNDAALGEVPAGAGLLCTHAEGYPAGLRRLQEPPLIAFLGGAPRLARLLARPTVAFLDSRESSGYGRAMAASFARGLAAAGLTVVSALGGPIARAAQQGALDAGAPGVAVVGKGLALPAHGEERRLRRGLLDAGGVLISELPWRASARAWGPIVAERIVLGLCEIALLIEAPADTRGLWAARRARALDCALLALPGQVTNPLAAGPHRLIAEGAMLAEDAETLLDLLHERTGTFSPPPRCTPHHGLAPRLRRALDAVGAGEQTAGALHRALGGSSGETLALLGELEALGLVSRTSPGRYVRSEPAPHPP